MRLRGDAGVVKQLERLIDPGTVAGLTESELVSRFVDRRDPVAFEAIVSRHGPMVLSVCRVMLADANDVDDAFQATFAILIEKASDLRHPERLGPWLHGVAYRVAHRARMRRRPCSIPEDLAGRSTGDQAERHEEIAALHDEIERLPEKYRLPVVLCCLEEQTGEQAARRLGWPVGTVHGRLSRARDLLRDRLSRHARRAGYSSVSLGLPFFGAEKAVVPEELVRATVGLLTRTVPMRLQTLVAGVLSAMFLEKMKALGVASALAISVVTTVSCLVVFPPKAPTLSAQVGQAITGGEVGKRAVIADKTKGAVIKSAIRPEFEPLSNDTPEATDANDGAAARGAGIAEAKLELLELECTIIRKAIMQTKTFLVGVDTEGLESTLRDPDSTPTAKQSAEVSLANVRSSAAHLERLKKEYMIAHEKIASLKAKGGGAGGTSESTSKDPISRARGVGNPEADDAQLSRLQSDLDLLELRSDYFRDAIKKSMAWLDSAADNQATTDFGMDEKADEAFRALRAVRQAKCKEAIEEFKRARSEIAVIKSKLARRIGPEKSADDDATGDFGISAGHRLERLEKKIDDISARLSRSNDRREAD
jgi:RNA polymerase sigma factor (sigma-70 family)